MRPSNPASRTAPGGPPPLLRGPGRGFTLIELVVVVVIIGIFAVMAMPQITLQLRDRRTHEAAQRVALIYQQARTRAMGQGGAVLVHYEKDKGIFETREALAGPGAGCAEQPVPTCTGTNWDDATKLQFRVSQRMGLGKVYNGKVHATLTPHVGSDSDALDVCFTPLGRSFFRYVMTAGTPFTPLNGVPEFNVFRGPDDSTALGLTRHVLVLPSGIARLQL